MSVVEQQAEELCIDTSRGGEGGWHKGNALVIRIIRLVLRNFFPGRIPEGFVNVGRVTQLVHLVRVVRVTPPLMRDREIKDQVAMRALVMQELPNLHVSALPAPACCNRRLDPHLVTEGTEERPELRDGPVVRLGRSSHRLTAVDMVGQMS